VNRVVILAVLLYGHIGEVAVGILLQVLNRIRTQHTLHIYIYTVTTEMYLAELFQIDHTHV
jgi:hypothetical protein